MSLHEVLADRRSALVGQWVDRTLATYPPATARLMAAEADPFRNPAGHTLRENLGVLFDAAILSDDRDAATRALGEIMRLRAVQDFTAAQAIGFIAMLKPIVRATVRRTLLPAEESAVNVRIDRLTETALGIYADCCRRMQKIRANELERRTWALTRVRRTTHP